MQGQKIRVMENQLHISIWQALGANPTPMAFSEVYMALQQGTIDAQENGLTYIYSSKIYEAQEQKVFERRHHYCNLQAMADAEEAAREKEEK